MAVLAWGAAQQDCATFDEIAYIGAGLSYVQKLDMRFFEEHPPLVKVIAAIPLSAAGVSADYSGPVWTHSASYFSGYAGEWIFGGELLLRWNDARRVLMLARIPMLLLTLTFGWCVFWFARRMGGNWAGLLCLTVFVSTPLFLGIGPLVITDIALAFFALLTIWTFATLWMNPHRRNTILFGLALTAAILSKLPSLILFVAIGVFIAISIWRPLPEEPVTMTEARKWRNKRLRATAGGMLLAVLGVYCFYLIFSWNQSIAIPGLLAHPLAGRLLMPPWLFARSLVLFLATSGRSAYVLGHFHWHGVWYFFPVLLALKSSPGFIGLLVVLLAVWLTRAGKTIRYVVPPPFRAHWRMVQVTCAVFTGIFIVSHYNGDFRYFSFPVALLILLLAALPGRLARIKTPWMRRGTGVLVAALAIASLVTAVRAYPYFIPYTSVFAMGRPAWMLVNGGNLDWNQSLDQAEKFARARGIKDLPVQPFIAADVRAWVPRGRLWNCAYADSNDAGRWVVISAGNLIQDQTCSWLWQYPHQELAGGSMFAVHLPELVPPPGTPGRPAIAPLAVHRFGIDTDLQSTYVGLLDHPDRFPPLAAAFDVAVTQEARRKVARVRQILGHPW